MVALVLELEEAGVGFLVRFNRGGGEFGDAVAYCYCL